MKIRIGGDASVEEAEAIARAMATHAETAVSVYVGDADEPAATGEADRSPVEDDLGPTDRERELLEQIEAIEAGGPEKYKEQLPEAGKLFVRDRLELWFDPERSSAFEDGTFAEFDADDQLPADGLLTGAAEFEGRDVHFMANDYTVKRGSMAAKGVEKFLRMQQRALKTGKPVLYLMDSSGGRIDQQTGFFANREGIGKYYYNHSRLSGRVPQICVLYGPCIAGAAYTPVFADFTVMVEGMSSMAIASPRMVEMVTGEDISLQELGGPAVHAGESGSADLIARDERHARQLVAELVGYLPDNSDERPPKATPTPPKYEPNGIDSVVPQEPNKSYDMRDVIERVVDRDSFFELQPDYGPEILTGFAHLDGRSVGVIANQPAQRAGAIFPDAAEKAAGFAWTCDAYNVPLLYLCDTPGFMAGSQVEKDGILEQGKKMIYATSEATVPKQCVIVRKAYGAGIYAMSGPAYDPESTVALPSGEIGIMG
ncbi:propionyl-CoA carboxylase, partial [Halobacteriales archaeon QS_7_69_60]